MVCSSHKIERSSRCICFACSTPPYARLAARLTGWRVDIRSETEFAAEEAEHGYEEEEVQGRCAAVLSNGRRCPNASLPGSRYCGLESHQALAGIASDNIADLAPETAP